MDQTAQLGGGELALADILDYIKKFYHVKVVLFNDGPFHGLLNDKNISVHILSNSRKLSVINRNAGFISVLKAFPVLCHYVLQLALSARSYDIVFANSQKAFVVSAIVAVIMRKRLVWYLRDILTTNHFRPQLISTVVFLANRFAFKVFVNSQATANAFIEHGGCRNLVTLTYEGFNSELFKTIPKDAITAARRAICSETLPLIGIFGRITHWKGQHVLLQALLDVPDCHVVIVGDALFGEEVYKQTLCNFIVENGLSDRVHILGFRKDVFLLMQAVDIIVHCSVDPEPFGRVIVEGLFSQKPVVATNIGGAKEIIENEISGLLIEPNNHEVLADVLRRLITEPDLRKRLANHGYERAKNMFGVAKFYEKLDKDFMSIMY